MLARICALLLALTLSACGGGGGDAGNPITGGGTGTPVFVSCSANLVIEVGRAVECTIGSGKTPYTVISSDVSVATAGKTSDTVFGISGVRAGSATVTVKDALGSSSIINVTVGSADPLFLSAPAQVALNVGAAQSFVIGGGAGPYTAAVGNSSIVTAKVTGSTLTLTGGQSGSTTVVVIDSRGTKVPEVNVTVGGGANAVALYTTAASPLVVAPGSAPTFDIGGGTGPYRATSSDASVVEVTVNAAGKLSVTGRAVGTASVVVTDAVGASKTLAVTVGSATVVALYTTAPADLNLKKGVSQSFAIGGGVGPYAVSSGNSAVLNASISGGALQLQALATGTASVSIFDSQGRSVTFATTVFQDAPLAFGTSAPNAVVLSPGASGTYSISGGTTPYAVTTSDASVVSVSSTAANFTVTAVQVGSAQVVVTDAAGSRLQVGFTVASATPLFVSSAASVSLAVGTGQVYEVGGGTPGYTVSSSNTSVVTASLSGTRLTLNALSTGTATVVVRDAAGATQSVAVTASPAAALFTSAPSAITVVPASTQAYTVGGGVAPYTATSSNTAVATAAVGGNTLTVNGVGSGTATVSIRDASGSAVSLGVSVSTTSAQALVVTPTTASGTVGETLSFAIRGGDGPYTVTANNAAVAAISASGSTFTANLVKAGQTTISVIDAKGQIQAVALTVAPAPGTPLFVSAASAVSLAVGTGEVYEVGGGTPGYNVSSSNTSVVTASLSGTRLTLNALSTGTATVVVRDAAGATQSVAVTASPAVALFTSAPSAITVVPASTQAYTVGGGVAPYTATSSNAAVATAAVSGNTLTVNGVGPGTATVSLRDALGVAIPVTVVVSATGSQPLTVSPSAISGLIGDSLTITMFGGEPAYSVIPTNPLIASVASQSANRFVINLLKAGATSVVVADARGQVQTLTVTAVPAPVTPLALNVASPVSLTAGAARTIVVSGGTLPYAVGSSNEAVVQAALAGSVLTLTPLAAGSTTVQVTDAAGATVSLSAVVGGSVPLFTTAPSALNVTPGTSQTFSIAGGTGPYFVSTSSPAVASATVVGSILSITGAAPGNANLSVRDSLGASVGIAVNVGSQTPLYTSAPGNVVMSAGTPRTFLIGGGSPVFNGGVPAYSVSSSDNSVLTVSSTGSSLTVNAVASGTATVNIRDGIGGSTSFLVSVGGSTALFTTAPSAVSLLPGAGNAQTYEIRGGAAPYVVTSGNTSVVTVTQPSLLGTFSVTGIATGATSVVVTDRLGATVNVGVTVTSASSLPMTVSPLAASGNVGDVLRFEIRGGTPVYTATVNNTRIATAAPFGTANAFTVDLNAAGSTNISVIDANGQFQNVSVTAAVGSSAPLFTSAPPVVTLAVGSPRIYEVGGGAGSYRYQSSNTAVATVASTTSTTYTVTPVAPGVASIVVSDTAGSRFSFDVNVGQVQPLVLSSGPILTLSPSAGLTTYEILGGRAPYSAVSSNPSVLSAVTPVVGSTLSITPVAAGTSNVIVTDAAGAQVTVTVTVVAYGPTTMQVSPATAGASVGEQLAVVVKGGTPPYAFSVSNPAVATLTNLGAASAGTSAALFSINQSASTIQTFDSNGNVVSVPGVVVITVTDAGGQIQTTSVTVTQASSVLRMSPSSVLLSERAALGALDTTAGTSNLKLYIYGGTGPYVAYSTNTSQARVSVLGDVVYVFSGTSGNLCGAGVYLATSPVSATPFNAFDLAITVVDSKGASAVTRVTLIDEAVCP